MPNNTLATNLQRLVDAKSDIADAITAKGGTVSQGDGFEEFPTSIASIPSGGNNFAKMPQTARAKPYDLCTYALGTTSLYSNLQIISNPIDYRYIWTDGNDIYYSYGLRQYILNVFTWKPKTWNGLTSFNGSNVWTDGDNIYYSSGSTHYVLNRETSTWVTKTWSGLTSFNGSNVHKINNNIYYSASNVLDKSTSTWYSVTWSGHITSPSNRLVINNRMAKALATGKYDSGSTYTYPCMCHELTHKWITMSGQYVWSDGTDLYYSCFRDDSSSYDSDIHFKLDRDTLSWIPIMFEGFPYTYNNNLYGDNLWEDGNGNFYFSQGYFQYKYDAILDNWVWQTWNGGLQFTGFDGKYIWSDGDNIYYSYNSNQYILNKETSTWETKIWTGLTSFRGDYIWTDGENIYYSGGSSSTHYVLNKSTSTWTTKTWSGFTSFYGDDVWTDGENIYYSYSSAQYVLNKVTSTWVTKTWSGLTSFNGSNVWSDGTDIYYSNGSDQYALDKATSTWSTKTWSSLSYIYGSYIYRSNDNHLYYMNNTNGYIYIFNTDRFVKKSTWRSKHIDGRYIWSDGENIYYSYISDQYVLNKSTGTWSNKTWSGVTPTYGYNIWTDGDNIYYSAGSSSHYVLDKSTSTWNSKTWSGYTNFYGNTILKLDNDTIFTADNSSQQINYKLNKSTSTWSSYQFSESNNQYRKTKITPIAVMDNGAYVHSTYSNGAAWINKGSSNVSPISSARLNVANGFADNNNLYILDAKASTTELFAWGSATSPTSVFNFKDINDDYMCIGDTTVSANNNGPIKYSKRDHTFSRSLSSSGSVYSSGLWSDGEKIYYSIFNSYTSRSDNKQYMLGSNEKWVNRSALNYWTDGNNIYYSDGSDQYVLNKTISTWETKTWSGLTSFNGSNVWSDGTDIYYSNGSDQYALDKATSTWSTKTWSGLTSFNGDDVWTDGENIYYSYSSAQYVLNKVTSTWTTKTWSGLTAFSGSSLVSNGIYIMCYSSSSSSFSSRYLLDSTSGSWVSESLYDTSGSGSTLSLFNPQCWSDGTRVYTLSYLWDEPLI